MKEGLFYPSSHFFERDRNSIDLKGNQTDVLEQMYSRFDDRHSKLFEIIRAAEKPLVLDNQQMIFLQEFISTLFWRLPGNDELYIDEYKSNPNYSKTFKIVDKTTKKEINDSKTEDPRQSVAFIKAVRVLAGQISLLSYVNAQDYHYNAPYSQDRIFSKLSLFC